MLVLTRIAATVLCNLWWGGIAFRATCKPLGWRSLRSLPFRAEYKIMSGENGLSRTQGATLPCPCPPTARRQVHLCPIPDALAWLC